MNFDELRREYIDLFQRITIKPSWEARARAMADKVIANKARYRIIEDSTGVPWYFVGCLHAMESGCRFGTHLHNGDPLSARTVHVPAGRPARGAAPYSWEDSARDALEMKGLHNIADWSLARMLYEAERYNGWGYRKYHSHVKSPYLWSGTPIYQRGKYISDGRWSDAAVSGQVGLASLLMLTAEKDASIHLNVAPDEIEMQVVEGYPPIEPTEEVTPTPAAYPKADEARLGEAARKSRTITGALVSGLGSFVVYVSDSIKSGIDVLVAAAGHVTEWAPASTVLASVGGNAKQIGAGLAAAGVILVISRRLQAAQKGKIG